MLAVVVVGHGSLLAASGAAMIRLAARAQEAGVAPLVRAGFLNYSKPPFAETVARCAADGATEIVVLPYFLVPGKFVRENVPQLVRQAAAQYPQVRFAVGEPFGDHPALARLALQRAAEAAAPPHADTALLLMAHGSPYPESNAPIAAVADRARALAAYRRVQVCFLDLNEPAIDTAIDAAVADGATAVAAMPYFLQLGGHVAEDLPQIIAAAQRRHQETRIVLTPHLGYDPLLVQVIADRAAEVGKC